MSQPIAVNIISDDEDDDRNHNPLTPLPTQSKKQRTGSNSLNPAVFIIDDDPTPRKPSVGSTSSPSFVAETPLSELSKSQVSVVKCAGGPSDFYLRPCEFPDPKSSGNNGLICLESDNESEYGSVQKNWKRDETTPVAFEVARDSNLSSGLTGSMFSLGNANLTHVSEDSSSNLMALEDEFPQAKEHPNEETDRHEPVGNTMGPKSRSKGNGKKKQKSAGARGKKCISKEERIRLMEEKKLQKEQERLQKAARKAEAVEMKKLQKEKQKWEKGKFALKSIVTEIDTKVVEMGSIGGHLLTRFAEKGLSYRITSNPIERSVVWTMNVPEQILQLSTEGIKISYVLLVYEADEFCNLVLNQSLMEHVSFVRRHYPSHTICYLTNKLMAYINKREQELFKNPSSYSGWKRPPVEEALAKLTTHFVKVHSRQCIDEAELAEHVVGLTCSLASCQFRKKLTRLSVNANGSLVPKDCIDRNLIKKNLWLKALVAIPKVQPRFAIAIWKRYPTMKSLLSIYLDPNKSVHEKEFLLKDLMTEGLLGEGRRLGEICSKRVYRVLMAQCGSIKTDDVEDGADFFHHQSS